MEHTTDVIDDGLVAGPPPAVGGSGTLARQIEEGAPVDVFVSADEQTMDRLQRGGFVEVKTRRTILSNALVVVVPRDSRLRIASPPDLVRVRRIALAEPQSVPAGGVAGLTVTIAGGGALALPRYDHFHPPVFSPPGYSRVRGD